MINSFYRLKSQLSSQIIKHENTRYFFLQKLLTKDGSQQRSKIVPCCSPTQLAPLQLLYIDTNNTITQKTLPNMSVEACGCM